MNRLNCGRLVLNWVHYTSALLNVWIFKPNILAEIFTTNSLPHFLGDFPHKIIRKKVWKWFKKPLNIVIRRSIFTQMYKVLATMITKLEINQKNRLGIHTHTYTNHDYNTSILTLYVRKVIIKQDKFYFLSFPYHYYY